MVSLPAEASCEGWVVAYQHPCMHLPARTHACVGQGPEKKHGNFLIVKNHLPPVSPSHDVIKRTGRLNSKAPSHADFPAFGGILSSCRTLTSFPDGAINDGYLRLAVGRSATGGSLTCEASQTAPTARLTSPSRAGGERWVQRHGMPARRCSARITGDGRLHGNRPNHRETPRHTCRAHPRPGAGHHAPNRESGRALQPPRQGYWNTIRHRPNRIKYVGPLVHRLLSFHRDEVLNDVVAAKNEGLLRQKPLAWIQRTI